MTGPRSKELPPLDEAEARLYPGVPYHRLNREQRFKAYELAKQIIFERTGHAIPPAEPIRTVPYVS